MMKILIAPNAFKNSLHADEVADALLAGLKKSGLEAEYTLLPVGDGGDGTGPLLIRALNGRSVGSLATDPLGRKIKTSFGFVEESRTAIIELAGISGLRLLKPEEYDPLHASTYGLGEQIRQALDMGSKKIILGIGGSATADAGCGLAKALGLRFIDGAGKEFDPLPANLPELADIDLDKLDPRIFDTEIIVLCDVRNFLLGEKGAAKFFGKQKGASDADIEYLENAILHLTAVIRKKTGQDPNAFPHGGAAGGTAAGLKIFLHAQLVEGIEFFLDTIHADSVLENTGLLITGEGRIDSQTLEGKAPWGIARRAKKKNIPVIGIAGEIDEDPELKNYFDKLISINDPSSPVQLSMKQTPVNLLRAGEEIGRQLKGSQGDPLKL